MDNKGCLYHPICLHCACCVGSVVQVYLLIHSSALGGDTYHLSDKYHIRMVGTILMALGLGVIAYIDKSYDQVSTVSHPVPSPRSSNTWRWWSSWCCWSPSN